MLQLSGVDTAAGFGFRDETAERIGTYLQRLAAVSAHTPLEALDNSKATISN
ncbi:hypothetical protein [Shewanella sp. 0m-4]